MPRSCPSFREACKAWSHWFTQVKSCHEEGGIRKHGEYDNFIHVPCMCGTSNMYINFKITILKKKCKKRTGQGFGQPGVLPLRQCQVPLISGHSQSFKTTGVRMSPWVHIRTRDSCALCLPEDLGSHPRVRSGSVCQTPVGRCSSHHSP